MSELIGTLKDISLGIGAVGFTYWQWTMPRNYQFKQRHLCGLKIPFFLVWIILYALLAASWLCLLFTATATMDYLIPNVVLMIVGLVLNKLWTVFAADLVARYPQHAYSFNVLAFCTLLCMMGIHVVYLTLTALDGSWWAFGLSVPYPAWLLLAAWLSMPLEKPLIRTMTGRRVLSSGAPDSDDDDELSVTQTLFDTTNAPVASTVKRSSAHSGLRSTPGPRL